MRGNIAEILRTAFPEGELPDDIRSSLWEVGVGPLGPIQFLTVHCAATPEGRDVRPETVEQWDIAKFGQKSYHWIIPLDGEPHRSLRDDQRGAHVGGHNTGNIGVCYVGGCDANMNAKDTRTDAQKKSLLSLIRTYQERYPGIVVRGHRDWPGVTKACPSFDVTAWLKEADHA
jgi:N-acetyl-anhydromuramyl-L-alanine amidase AmpD